MNCAAERCSAPKTAKGRAKHKLLNTATLSRPRAGAMSVFTDHSAIRKSRIAAPDIEAGVRANSNIARMVKCIGKSRAKARAGNPVEDESEKDCTTKSCP